MKHTFEEAKIYISSLCPGVSGEQDVGEKMDSVGEDKFFRKFGYEEQERGRGVVGERA